MLLRWRALEKFYCGLGPGLRGRGRCRFAGSQMSGDRKGGFGLGMFWGQGGGERRRRHEKSVSLRQGERCRPPLATNDLSGPAASSPILCLPSCHRSQGPVALAAHCSTSFFSSLGANTSHLHLQATTGKVRMQTARVQVDSRRPASPVSQAVAVLAGYRKGGRRDGGREATPLGKGGEPGSGSGSGSVAAADT